MAIVLAPKSPLVSITISDTEALLLLDIIDTARMRAEANALAMARAGIKQGVTHFQSKHAALSGLGAEIRSELF